jgi:hypothetical protein
MRGEKLVYPLLWLVVILCLLAIFFPDKAAQFLRLIGRPAGGLTPP